MKRAVFLDRDGTLIEEKHYLHKPEDVVFIPGSLKALKELQDHGFLLILVTNQSGVGRGYFTMKDVNKVHHHIGEIFKIDGGAFDRIYVAPEAPDTASRGRKPSPQFLFDARDELGIALGRSFMIGDKVVDLECGWNAGVEKSILVRTGYGKKTEQESAEAVKKAIVVDDICAASSWILNQ